MVIEKVHGLHATGMSLNERFSMLASAAPDRPINRPNANRRRTPANFNQNLNVRNRALIEEIARRLERQSKINALRHRLGNNQGNLRRSGSMSSLPGLRRANSFGNLSNYNYRPRGNWRGSNRNLSRSASISNLSQAGGRRRGAGRPFRAMYRGTRQGRIMRRTNGPTRGAGRGAGRGGARGRGRGAARGGARGRGRGEARGGGRGITRNQLQKPVPSREELDHQLDQYMASSKSVLDKELDNYMNNAMEME